VSRKGAVSAMPGIGRVGHLISITESGIIQTDNGPETYTAGIRAELRGATTGLHSICGHAGGFIGPLGINRRVPQHDQRRAIEIKSAFSRLANLPRVVAEGLTYR
jgi:hypothetical protein